MGKMRPLSPRSWTREQLAVRLAVKTSHEAVQAVRGPRLGEAWARDEGARDEGAVLGAAGRCGCLPHAHGFLWLRLV